MAQSVQDEATASTHLENPVDGAPEGDIAPLDAIPVVPKRKEAPPERPESVTLRRLVVFSFWAIVLFLGLPIWWRTTTIYRAKLPLSQMMDWAEGRVRWQLSFVASY
jgi:GPI-anchor transamidase subunit S